MLQERDRVGASTMVFVDVMMMSTPIVAPGLVTVLPDFKPVPSFNDYIGSWSLSNNMDPWFQEYYKVSGMSVSVACQCVNVSMSMSVKCTLSMSVTCQSVNVSVLMCV